MGIFFFLKSMGVIQGYTIAAGVFLNMQEHRISTKTCRNGQFFTYVDYSLKE